MSCAAPPKPAVTAPLEPRDLVRAVLTRAYSSLERGEVDELAALFSPNAVAFGPSPGDTLAGREPLSDELRRRLMPLGLGAGQLKVTRSSPTIGLSPSETSAWLWDLPVVEFTARGAPKAAYKVRLTAHLIKDADGWAVDAAHLSLGILDDELFKPTAPKTLGLPREVAGEAGPGTEPLLELLKLVLKDQAAKIERTSDRDEVVLIGTGPAELFEGGKKFKAWGRSMLPQLKKAVVKLKVDGAVTSRLAPDGETGFIATNLSLTLGAGKKAQTLPPFRSLWVFVREKGEWAVVQDHESSGLPQPLWRPND